jgi:hypothetical protein
MGAEKRDYSRDVRPPLTRDGVDGENSRLLLLLRGRRTLTVPSSSC